MEPEWNIEEKETDAYKLGLKQQQESISTDTSILNTDELFVNTYQENICRIQGQQ